MGLLGSQLLEGPLLQPDSAEAHRWLAPAAAAGDAQALYALGYAYLFGLGVDADRTRAEALLHQGTESGSGDARLWSGWLGRIPAGAERGTSSAVELMAARVAVGDEWAMPVLLEWMAQGSTSTAQREAAVARLERAAQEGRAPALALLADLELHGLTGRAADPAHAVELARRAAEAGSAAAMSTLGHAYHRGAGVPNELDRAYEWWERAAGAGHRNAQLVLGRAYLDGREVTRDAERGIALLEQAAEAGELRAMRDLADLFDTGWAVIPPDLDRAHRWYERLAANGDELARGWLRYQEIVGSR
jgi:TPR repeat protein